MNAKNEEKDTDSDLNLPTKKFIFIGIIVALLCYLLFSILQPFFFLKKKYSKQYLAQHYKVDKKTFNKWSIFWKNANGILDDYPKRKLLTIEEVKFIKEKLGDPRTFPVMSKKDIITKAEGTYKTLRKSVEKYPHQFGIAYDDFLRMKKFPPAIAQKIMEQYG